MVTTTIGSLDFFSASSSKQLISLAGKKVIDHVLDQLKKYLYMDNIEFIFIVGKHQEQIRAHMETFYPGLSVSYISQDLMLGQSHAIYMAKEKLFGPQLIIFPDTLIESKSELIPSGDVPELDGIINVIAVSDTKSYGTVEVDSDGWVEHLQEKSPEPKSNLAAVGYYFFSNGQKLALALDEQFSRDLKFNNEYYLTDAINIMLSQGAKFRSQNVDVWLDTGTPTALLNTNAYLLANKFDNSQEVSIHFPGNVIRPPVFIHETAQIESSVIGPNVTIDKNCKLTRTIIANSIVQEDSEIISVSLENSLIGYNVHIESKGDSVQIDS